MKNLVITTWLLSIILFGAMPTLAADFEGETQNLFVSEFNLRDIVFFEGVSNTISKNLIASTTGGQKSPLTAFVLSALLPGAGQYYNDQLPKGVIQFVISLGGYAAFYLALEDNVVFWGSEYDVDDDDAMGRIGLLIGFSAHLWSIIDAPISANNINKQNQLQVHLIENKSYSVFPLVKHNKLGAKFTLQF